MDYRIVCEQENGYHAMRVKCKNTGDIFIDTLEAGEWCGLKSGRQISANIRGKAKSAGKHPVTGEKLTWEYVVMEYLEDYYLNRE